MKQTEQTTKQNGNQSNYDEKEKKIKNSNA